MPNHKKNPKVYKTARKAAKQSAKLAGGSRRSGRIAARTVSQELKSQGVKRGRVSSKAQYDALQSLGSSTGMSAGSTSRALRSVGGPGGKINKRKAIKSSAQAGVKNKGVISFLQSGTKSGSRRIK